MSDSATKLTKADIERANARRYLADVAYRYLLGKSQPAKLRQIVKGLDMDVVTTRLIRDVMASSDKFECVDRRWAPSVRYGDTRKPFERIVLDIMVSAGVPVELNVLAAELGLVFDRPAEVYEEQLPKFLSNKDKFFETPDGKFGPASWLLQVTSDSEEDVLFDNFLTAEEVEQFASIYPDSKWDSESCLDSAAKLVSKSKEPVPIKILAFLAWREQRDDFDPVEFYSRLINDQRIVVLSDQKAYSSSAINDFKKTLGKIAEELAELPMDVEEESEGPITVTETDKEEMINIILEKGSASAEELLEAVLEVTPEESAYQGALESLREALSQDERIMFVGADRWSKVVEFPEEVKVIPEALIVPPSQPYETPEGDIYDQELEEEGFEGDLKAAIYDPLVEDVTDEDPARTMYQPNGDSQRCVLKYHHKVLGTFPMCQINPDFFGVEPEIIPIYLSDEGKRKQVFVNNTTRLIYGLEDFYKDITEVSGAVFYIEKTDRPGEYRFRYDNETEHQLHIDTNRSLELLDIKARFESQDMPIFDVVTEILQRSGMTFTQLVNEVNIVKRVSRLLVASILSSYHCFSTRGKSNIWQYDEKKRSQGFNKTKRKYIKK